MLRSRLLASCLAILASGLMVTACGSGGSGGTAATGGTTGSTTGGTKATTGGTSGGCATGAAGTGTAVTAPSEPDAQIDTPDGKCWASIKPTAISIVGNGTIPSGDTTTFKTAWSPKGLYIQATTLEWPLNAAGGTNWWQSDTTEYAVSGVDDHAGTMDATNSFQFGIVSDGSLQDGTNGSQASPAPTAKVKTNQGKGFTTELFVPWATLQVSGAKKGGKYQFDLAEDYGDSGGNRVGQALWAGDGTFYNNTTNWGDITLG